MNLKQLIKKYGHENINLLCYLFIKHYKPKEICRKFGYDEQMVNEVYQAWKREKDLIERLYKGRE